jgi:hypothetical protein
MFPQIRLFFTSSKRDSLMQGNAASFCVPDHRPVCARVQEKSAMVAATARKAPAENCAKMP